MGEKERMSDIEGAGAREFSFFAGGGREEREGSGRGERDRG